MTYNDYRIRACEAGEVDAYSAELPLLCCCGGSKLTSDTVNVGNARASTTMSAMSLMNAGSVFSAGTLEPSPHMQSERGGEGKGHAGVQYKKIIVGET